MCPKHRHPMRLLCGEPRCGRCYEEELMRERLREPLLRPLPPGPLHPLARTHYKPPS